MKVTKVAGCLIREAAAKDVELVLSFIKRLAQYEKMEDEVTATLETLYDSLFVKKAAKAVIAELQGMPVGFAVYFYNFSTFLGKPGLYLEDLFVVPEMRGRGIGKALRFDGKLAAYLLNPSASGYEVKSLAAEYGVTAIVQPGGSIRDEDSIRKANEKGIAMLFTGERHFKH